MVCFQCHLCALYLFGSLYSKLGVRCGNPSLHSPRDIIFCLDGFYNMWLCIHACEESASEGDMNKDRRRRFPMRMHFFGDEPSQIINTVAVSTGSGVNASFAALAAGASPEGVEALLK